MHKHNHHFLILCSPICRLLTRFIVGVMSKRARNFLDSHYIDINIFSNFFYWLFINQFNKLFQIFSIFLYSVYIFAIVREFIYYAIVHWKINFVHGIISVGEMKEIIKFIIDYA